MSLINDALKRASQSTTAPAPVPPNTVKPDAPLRPIEYKKATPWPLVIVSVLLVISIAVGGWLFFRNPGVVKVTGFSTDQTHAQARQSATTPDPAPLAVLTTPASPQPIPEEAKATVTSRPTTLGMEAPQALAATSSSNPTVSSSPQLSVALPTPAYKLQGIFYRPDHPMAMINGKNVIQGDKVSDARVVSIGRESVTLSVDGQTKVLTLSQNN